MLRRAIASVYAQTVGDWEIIVAFDGPNPEAEKALRADFDERLRFLQAEKVGCANPLRNRAIEESRGHWIAFLDDDDEFLPGKLAAQLAIARKADSLEHVISCRTQIRHPEGTFTVPRRLPAPGEDIVDYMTLRKTPFYGEGLITLTSLLIRRDLLVQYPLDNDKPFLDEFVWFVETLRQTPLQLTVAPETGQIWYMGFAPQSSTSVRNSGRSRQLVQWTRLQRSHISRRAYGACMLTFVADECRRHEGLGATLRLLPDALRHGRPGPMELLAYARIAALPPPARARLRNIARRIFRLR